MPDNGTRLKASTSSTKSAVEVLREWPQMVEALSWDESARAAKEAEFLPGHDADHLAGLEDHLAGLGLTHLYGCTAIVEQLGRIADALEEANHTTRRNG